MFVNKLYKTLTIRLFHIPLCLLHQVI